MAQRRVPFPIIFRNFGLQLENELGRRTKT